MKQKIDRRRSGQESLSLSEQLLHGGMNRSFTIEDESSLKSLYLSLHFSLPRYLSVNLPLLNLTLHLSL